MPRRETVVPPLLDVEELVERIPVREPGRALLVGREEIPGGVEAERDRKADPRGDDLAAPQIGRHAEDGPALGLEPVRNGVLPAETVGIREVARSYPEVNAPVLRVHGGA